MYLRELSKDTEIYEGALDNYLDLEKFFKCFLEVQSLKLAWSISRWAWVL